MASRSLRFVIDTENGRLLPGFRSVVSTIVPRFTVGDQVPVEVYLCRGSGVALQEVPFPAGCVLRLGVGEVNQSPTAGTWNLTFDGDTTSALPYNATAAQVQTALNALASVTAAGGVTVEKVGDAYSIAFNTAGDQVAITGSPGSLVPLSSIAVQTLQEGTVSLPEVVLVQVKVRPIAFTETFTDLPAPAISRTGQTWAITGQVKSGSYTLSVTYDGDTQETGQIPYNASTATVESAILAALKLLDWPAGTDSRPVRVTQVDSQTWAVSFWDGGSYLSGVNGANLVGFAAKAGTLSLATTEALAFIGSEVSKRAVFEAEVEVGGERQTLVQAGADILGDLILAGAFEPMSLEDALSEAVANERFIRRDADQTLDATTKDQIWENLLGATSPTGVDIVGAITGADTPSAANVLVTQSVLSGYLDTATAAATYQTISGMSAYALAADFDQSLKTSDSPSFEGLSLTGNNAVFDDAASPSTYQFKWDAAAATAGIWAGAVPIVELTSNGIVFGSIGASLTFSDSTVQESAPVVSSGTVIHSGGGGHIDALDYPDEIRIVIGGVTYAMPARVI